MPFPSPCLVGKLALHQRPLRPLHATPRKANYFHLMMGDDKKQAWIKSPIKDPHNQTQNPIKDPKNPRVKLFQRLGFFLICLGVLIYLSFLSISKFAQGETATADKYEHLTQVEFPEITLCPSVPYNREILRKIYGISEVNDLQFSSKWNESPHFLDKVSIPIDDIYESSTIFTEQSLGGDVTEYHLNGTEVNGCRMEPLWHVKEYYFNGLCYSFVLPKCIRDLGVLELSLFLHRATDAFIHHKGQFLSPNSRSRVKLRQGNLYEQIRKNYQIFI